MDNLHKNQPNAPIAPPPRKVVVLTIAGRTQRFDKDRIVIGSVISADIRLTGEGIAPIHAVIEASAIPCIYDLASETGITVNGNKTVTQVLKPGDRIGIAGATLQFGVEDMAVPASEGQKLFVNPEEDFKPLLLEEERAVEQIFDSRPATKRALEVVMSWSEVILNVAHFGQFEDGAKGDAKAEKAVLLGDSKKAHFPVPPILSSAEHPLALRMGETFILNLDPKMTGVVQRKGQLQTLDQLRAATVPGANGAQIPLDRDDFAKISVGDVSFYLSYTAAPPKLRPNRLFERDPLFMRILLSSLLLTAVTVIGLSSIKVPQTLEAEQLPDRIATILYQPEKYVAKKKELAPDPMRAKPPEPPKPAPTVKVELKPEPPKNKPVPETMNLATKKPSGKKAARTGKASGSQNQAKEGQGARAKGPEGTRGKVNAPVADQAQTKATRPSAQGGPGRGQGDSQVPDMGNVDFLKGATGKIENILGSSAAKLGKGGEKLKGFGGFDTRGNGGLALSGSGQGGGGTAESLGGLSDKGRGGGRVGTGLGAAGTGSGIIGGKARVELRTGGPEETVVMGAIDPDAIRRAIEAHRDEFRLCYERELNAENQKLSGTVGTSFVIGASGKVNQAGVQSSSLNNPGAERCVLDVIKRIQFPIPKGAGIVQVSFPFKFAPGR